MKKISFRLVSPSIGNSPAATDDEGEITTRENDGANSSVEGSSVEGSPLEGSSFEALLQSNDLLSSPPFAYCVSQTEKRKCANDSALANHAPEGFPLDYPAPIDAIHDPSVLMALYTAGHMIRGGNKRHQQDAIGILNAIIAACPDNPECREDLFEQKYFSHILMAIALFKLNDDDSAEASLQQANETAERFRLDSQKTNNTEDIQQRHFSRLGKLLSYYIQNEDLTLSEKSHEFRAIWNLREISINRPKNRQPITLAKLRFSPTFFGTPPDIANTSIGYHGIPCAKI